MYILTQPTGSHTRPQKRVFPSNNATLSLPYLTVNKCLPPRIVPAWASTCTEDNIFLELDNIILSIEYRMFLNYLSYFECKYIHLLISPSYKLSRCCLTTWRKLKKRPASTLNWSLFFGCSTVFSPQHVNSSVFLTVLSSQSHQGIHPSHLTCSLPVYQVVS